MDEVRLTLNSFLLLCKLLIDTTEEKERLRKIVVMQNGVLDKLTSPKATEERWLKEYRANFMRLQAKRLDKAMEDAFWPPLGMIP